MSNAHYVEGYELLSSLRYGYQIIAFYRLRKYHLNLELFEILRAMIIVVN